MGRPSLTRQIEMLFKDALALHESRHKAKRNGTSLYKVHSLGSFKVHMQRCNTFANNWCKEGYRLRWLRDITEDMVRGYMADLEGNEYSDKYRRSMLASVGKKVHGDEVAVGQIVFQAGLPCREVDLCLLHETPQEERNRLFFDLDGTALVNGKLTKRLDVL